VVGNLAEKGNSYVIFLCNHRNIILAQESREREREKEKKRELSPTHTGGCEGGVIISSCGPG